MFFSFLGKFSENVVQWFHKNSQMVFIENIKVDVKSTYFFKNQTKSNFHDPSSTNQSNLKIHHHGYLVFIKINYQYESKISYSNISQKV